MIQIQSSFFDLCLMLLLKEKFLRLLAGHTPICYFYCEVGDRQCSFRISNDYVQLLENIAQGRQNPPAEYVVPIHEIPAEYTTFDPSSKRKKK
jgi:hypothetical protein